MNSLFDYDLEHLKEYDYIIGLDEVGRGCLAGPLVVCGVIMTYEEVIDLINDSKQISEKKRNILNPLILEKTHSHHIIEVNVEDVDKLNVYQATKQAMEKICNELYLTNTLILSDAMKLDIEYPYEAIIKGDTKSYAIACASILAKVYRDNILIDLDKVYPEYDFINNKGYGTKKHIEAIHQYGYLEDIHRLSFEPIKSLNTKQLKLDI